MFCCVPMSLDWIVPSTAAPAAMTSVEASPGRVRASKQDCVQRLSPPCATPVLRSRTTSRLVSVLGGPNGPAHLHHNGAKALSHGGVLASHPQCSWRAAASRGGSLGSTWRGEGRRGGTESCDVLAGPTCYPEAAARCSPCVPKRLASGLRSCLSTIAPRAEVRRMTGISGGQVKPTLPRI